MQDHLVNELETYTRIDVAKRIRDNPCPGNKFFKNRMGSENKYTNRFYCFDTFEIQDKNVCRPDPSSLNFVFENKNNQYLNKYNNTTYFLDPNSKSCDDVYSESGALLQEGATSNNIMQEDNKQTLTGSTYGKLDMSSDVDVRKMIKDRIRLRSWIIGSNTFSTQTLSFKFGNYDFIDALDTKTKSNNKGFYPINVMTLLHKDFIRIRYDDKLKAFHVHFECEKYWTKTDIGSMPLYWRDRKVSFDYPQSKNPPRSYINSQLSPNYQLKDLMRDQFVPDYKYNGGNPRFGVYWDAFAKRNMLELATNYFLRRMVCKIQQRIKSNKNEPFDEKMDVVVGTGLIRFMFQFIIRVRINAFVGTKPLLITDLSVTVTFQANKLPKISDMTNVCVTPYGNVLFENNKSPYRPMFCSSLDNETGLQTSWTKLRGSKLLDWQPQVTNNVFFHLGCSEKQQIDASKVLSMKGLGSSVNATLCINEASVIPTINPDSVFKVNKSVNHLDINRMQLHLSDTSVDCGMLCYGTWIDCKYYDNYNNYVSCDFENPSSERFEAERRLRLLFQNYTKQKNLNSIPQYNKLLEYEMQVNSQKKIVRVCLSPTLKYMLFLSKEQNEWLLYYNGFHEKNIFSNVPRCNNDNTRCRPVEFIEAFKKNYCDEFVHDPNSEKGTPSPPGFRKMNNADMYVLSGLYIDPVCNLVSSNNETSTINPFTFPSNWNISPFQMAMFRYIIPYRDGFGTRSDNKRPIKQEHANSYRYIAEKTIQPQNCDWLMPYNGLTNINAHCQHNNDLLKENKNITDILMNYPVGRRYESKNDVICLTEQYYKDLNVNGLGNKVYNNTSINCGGDGTPNVDTNKQNNTLTPTNIAIYTCVGVVLFVIVVIFGFFLYNKIYKKT